MSKTNGQQPVPPAQVVNVNVPPEDAVCLLYCDLASHMLVGMAKQLEQQARRPEVAKHFAAAAGAFLQIRDGIMQSKRQLVTPASALPPPPDKH